VLPVFITLIHPLLSVWVVDDGREEPWTRQKEDWMASQLTSVPRLQTRHTLAEAEIGFFKKFSK
jgi:hypothetical protein